MFGGLALTVDHENYLLSSLTISSLLNRYRRFIKIICYWGCTRMCGFHLTPLTINYLQAIKWHQKWLFYVIFTFTCELSCNKVGVSRAISVRMKYLSWHFEFFTECWSYHDTGGDSSENGSIRKLFVDIQENKRTLYQMQSTFHQVNNTNNEHLIPSSDILYPCHFPRSR